MRGALILLALCASAWGQQPPELTRARALELWPVYVATQRAPLAPGAMLARLNMYRQAAGLEAVTEDAGRSVWAQACAEVLSVNPGWPISHTMPRTLTGWTDDAARAAAGGCIDRQDDGARAVGDLLRDWGLTPENRTVGHRRWLLAPGLRTVGIGAVGASLTRTASACVYVMTPQSAARQVVAWPPAGEVPIAWVPERWSYSAPGVDLSGTTVYVDGRHCTTARTAAFVVFNPSMAFNAEQTHRVEVRVGGQVIRYQVHRFRP